MSYDYRWIPVLCANVLAGREGRNSVRVALEPISASVEELARSRAERNERWAHGRSRRCDVLTARKLAELSQTEAAALREAIDCLRRFGEGGGSELLYRARSRYQLAELSERRYTGEWLRLAPREIAA